MVLRTSAGASPLACSMRVFRSTITCRCLPPNGNGMATPRIVTSWGRRKLTPRSKSCCSASPSPDSASWRIGTLDALKLMISGGPVPGGYWRSTVWEIGGDLGVGGVQARVRLQVDLDDGLPVDGGGLDALDVVHRGREHALVRGRDPPFQLLGVQPGVLPGHRDDRDVDRGKDVGGRARDDDRTGDQDQEREDDEGVRPIQGDPDDPHGRECA